MVQPMGSDDFTDIAAMVIDYESKTDVTKMSKPCVSAFKKAGVDVYDPKCAGKSKSKRSTTVTEKDIDFYIEVSRASISHGCDSN